MNSEKKCYEVIRELDSRGVVLRLGGDGKIYADDPAKIADMLPALKEHRARVLAYVTGEYSPTVDGLCRELGSGRIHYAFLREKYPEEVLREATRGHRAVEQLNGFYRLPNERDRERWASAGKSRRKR